MSAVATFARVVGIKVPEVFESSEHDQLTALVEIHNTSEFAHSAQVVFRGFVTKKNVFVYEFFHEQVWILVPEQGGFLTFFHFSLLHFSL